MRTPAVTVVIPCFNAAEFIAATLASVRAQTLTRWQVVVVDDGSTDGSAEIVEAIARRDPRITLIRQSRAGVSVARNLGASLAEAGLIAFLDADDLWDAAYLSEMLDFMSGPGAPNLGYARVRFVDRSGRRTGQRSRAKLAGLTIEDMLAGNPTMTTSNLVIRRSLLDRLGGFEPGLDFAEDQLLLVRAFLSGARISGLDRELVSYRTVGGGLSSKLEAMRLGWERLVERIQTEFPGRIPKDVEEAARARNRIYLARRALRLADSNGTAWQLLAPALAAYPAALHRWPWPVLPITALALLDRLPQLSWPRLSTRTSLAR